jgi:hypothetical protein
VSVVKARHDEYVEPANPPTAPRPRRDQGGAAECHEAW